MISPSFGLTASERVLPKLSVDFTKGTLDSRVSVARSLNTATCVNSLGKIAVVNANLPRFEYDPITLACKGLLAEESKSNLYTYSSDFRNTTDAGETRPWVYTRVAVSADQINSPDGTQNADKIKETATTGSHNIAQGFSVVIGNKYTISIFYKAAERTFALIGNSGSTAQSAIGVNLSTGTAQASLGSPENIFCIDYGNGWYRCGFTITATATGTSTAFFFLSLDGDYANRSFAGTDGYGIYAWGAQVESDNNLTSYIPTVATSVTRNADVVTAAGQGVTAQGTFVVDATVFSGKTLLTSGSVTFAATASTAQKTAVAYDANSVLKSINAGAVTSAAGAAADADITLGNGGVFRSLKFYTPKLIDAELQTFSK